MKNIPAWVKMKAVVLAISLAIVSYQGYCVFQIPPQSEFERFFAVFGAVPMSILLVTQLLIRPPKEN